MRIASRINAALLGAFACGSVLSYLALEVTVHPRFDEIEMANARLDHDRVVEAIDAATEKLATATQDYSYWDETYKFVQGVGVDEFIASNLTPERASVENLGVEALIFQAADEKILFGAAYDLATGEPLEGLVSELAKLSAVYTHSVDATRLSGRGLFKTSSGLVLAAIAPIHMSDRSGVPLGRVISAKRLSIEALIEQTGVKFSIEQGVSPALLSGGPAVAVLPDKIVTSFPLISLTGEPLALVKVQSSREVSRIGNMAILSAMTLMVLAALLATATLAVFLKYTVVSRIEQLKHHIATAGSEGAIKRTVNLSRNDEITELATSFNAMADQVNHLRDALADNAYMSGLSEWATGTLHNVRNGIAPIAAGSWQIAKRFDGHWMQNVRTALREHDDPDTPADRRAKLNAFLVGSVGRLVQTADQTIETARTIDDSVRSVVEMVGEYERYARRDAKVDLVNLQPLVESTTSSVLSAANVQWTVETDKSVPAIRSNGILIRQVLANVLHNAVDATQKSGQLAKIDVRLAMSSVRPGFTRITVTDNGEGIAPEMLKRLFQRGASTRHGKVGGLGLHWCANAIKILGGTINVESEGVGKGASVEIEIPCIQSVTEKAA